MTTDTPATGNTAPDRDDTGASTSTTSPLEERLEKALTALESANARISALNKEAEKHRLRAQEEREKRAEEQGQWQELATERQRKIEEFEAQITRLSSYEQAVQASNERRIETIPDDMRTLVPTGYTPDQLSGWLDANLERLQRPTPPANTGLGEVGGAGQRLTGVKLTQEELAYGRQHGLTVEELQRAKAKIEKRSNG